MEVEYSTDSIITVANELAQVVAIFTFPEVMYESQPVRRTNQVFI
jgi:hypothetical protein